MNFNRKLLNQRQTELRQVMMGFDQHERAIALFLRQHASLHSAKMAQSESWSFEDELFQDMAEAQIRRIPRSSNHSVAWCLWHIARIEDVAMNMLVAGTQQVLTNGGWLPKLNLSVQDTGNAMTQGEIAELSRTIDIGALRDYRVAVGKRTQEIVQELSPETLKQKVDPARVEKIMAIKAVVEEARGIADYWRRRDIAGLLLMPATRHNLVHLNEAYRLKQRRQ